MNKTILSFVLVTGFAFSSFAQATLQQANPAIKTDNKNAATTTTPAAKPVNTAALKPATAPNPNPLAGANQTSPAVVGQTPAQAVKKGPHAVVTSDLNQSTPAQPANNTIKTNTQTPQPK